MVGVALNRYLLLGVAILVQGAAAVLYLAKTQPESQKDLLKLLGIVSLIFPPMLVYSFSLWQIFAILFAVTTWIFRPPFTNSQLPLAPAKPNRQPIKRLLFLLFVVGALLLQFHTLVAARLMVEYGDYSGIEFKVGTEHHYSFIFSGAPKVPYFDDVIALNKCRFGQTNIQPIEILPLDLKPNGWLVSNAKMTFMINYFSHENSLDWVCVSEADAVYNQTFIAPYMKTYGLLQIQHYWGEQREFEPINEGVICMSRPTQYEWVLMKIQEVLVFSTYRRLLYLSFFTDFFPPERQVILDWDRYSCDYFSDPKKSQCQYVHYAKGKSASKDEKIKADLNACCANKAGGCA